MPAASTESFSISAHFLDLVVAAPQSPWLQKEDKFCIIAFCAVMGELDEIILFLEIFSRRYSKCGWRAAGLIYN
jgi:hypothetical protein